MFRRTTAIAVIAAALIAPIPAGVAVVATATLVTVAPVQAAGCASKAEYNSVSVAGTWSPAKVQAAFGFPGRKTSEKTAGKDKNGNTIWLTSYRWSPACSGSGPGTPTVIFRGSLGFPAVAISKTWS